MKAWVAFASAIALLWLAALASGLLNNQARVICQDPSRGHLSADMDIQDVFETPAGWVLYFPHRADQERRVEFWVSCEVRP